MQFNKDLNTSIRYVKGIGPKRAKALKARGIETIHDLLYYFPYAYLDLSKVEKISNLRLIVNSGQWVTVIGTVRTFDLLGRPPRQRFVVVLGDDSGTVPIVFFQSVQYFKNAFKQGEMLAVSGKVTDFHNRPQIVHPSIDRLTSTEEGEEDFEGFLHTKGIVPKYGSSEELRDVNLDVKGIRRIMKSLLDNFLGSVIDPLPKDFRERNQLLTLQQSLSNVHFPESQTVLDAARRRLKFDELFSMQLLLALRRKSLKIEMPGIAFHIESTLARQLVDSLPFKLTKAQIRVINEIAADMRSSKPMNRLLQGDVGSGKTVVSLIAMLIAVDNGYQAAFMAPTEILAEQHYKTLANFMGNLPINVRLLVGGQRSKLRGDILEDVRRGSAQIVVGTHALIQEHVKFGRLGFVVIDEQHRFGVAQRIALKEKAFESIDHTPHPDVLVMTATPIPRTLSLTLYGDLDVSIIDELPTNRQSIQTSLKFEFQRESVFQFLRQQIVLGRQAYIVYPLVEESEKMDLKAATESYEMLKSTVFPDLTIGLIHGRMVPNEKDEIMTAFTEGEINILVATTVIEVGVDIPNATVMVIEHAERFGLAQLHQLRGRVGRGHEQSYCILIVPNWMAKLIKRTFTPFIDAEQEEQRKAVRRIQTMLETADGFKIAEIDLELRGPGEFFGTRQSGLPELQIANLVSDLDILSLARREAFQLIEHDPHLRYPEHQQLRKHFEERMKDALAFVQVG
ncbi:MAG: ATP-dependent DNA helicase RecG [Ignavibacteriae bacterium]|nr:ATP-dependent DNA helicase RecG [Ignavibacteriota bacterium]